MKMSEAKSTASVVAFMLIGSIIVYGVIWAILGERPSYGVRIIPDATPYTSTLYTQPSAAFANKERQYDNFEFVQTGRTLFTISPVKDGKFTVTLGPDVTWDEAGLEFWRLMETLAAPNTFIWESKP